MRSTQPKILSTILILVILIITGCHHQTEEKTKQPIKIGVIAPYSGALADYGVALRNGIILAQQELDNGVNCLEFIFEDSAYDNQKTISAFRKLVDLNQIDIVINFGNPTSEALLPISRQEGIPLIAFSSQPLSNIEGTQAIRSWAPVSLFAKTIYDYTQDQGWNNIGVIKTENLFLQGVYDSLYEFSHQNNTSLKLIDNYLFQDRDFSTSIQKIKDTKNLDAVGVLLLPGQISKFYKQLKEFNLKINTFGSDIFESQSEINDSQGTMDGAVYSYISVSGDFEQKYLKKFNTTSQIGIAGNAYDIACFLLTSLGQHNKKDVINLLRQMEGFNGTLGEYIYVETEDDRYLSQPIHIKQIENNTIKIIK